MGHRFLVGNFPMQTTAPPVKVALGAATLQTMMQIKPVVPCRIVEWGYSFDGFAAALPGTIELIETDVAATGLSAYADADFSKINNPGDTTALTAWFTESTSGSGYAANGAPATEGSITTVRNLDAPQLTAPTTQLIKQVPLGGEAVIQAAKFARIRMKFAGALNALCYMILEV